MRFSFFLLAGFAGSLLLAGSARGQSGTVVLFDEPATAGQGYYESSEGRAQSGDMLVLGGPDATMLPVGTDHAFSGVASGVLQYRHVSGGSWELGLQVEGAPVDLSGADSLVLYLDAPAGVPGADLPRLGLEDAAGHRTAYLPLALGTRKGFNSVRSGFQEGSATD
ncbi:MAG TPA: hypothetical protein VFG50_11595, partial [Rhodothermales bacterium]|nr:hypothetical protein [Rhodothermales bacterium]